MRILEKWYGEKSKRKSWYSFRYDNGKLWEMPRTEVILDIEPKTDLGNKLSVEGGTW